MRLMPPAEGWMTGECESEWWAEEEGEEVEWERAGAGMAEKALGEVKA